MHAKSCTPRGVIATQQTTVEANGVTLAIEHLGDAAAPLVLLAGGTTMLSWPDALCEALALVVGGAVTLGRAPTVARMIEAGSR